MSEDTMPPTPSSRELDAEFFRTVVQYQPQFVARWLPDGTLLFANEALCRFRGASLEEIVGTQELSVVMSPEEEEKVREKFLSLTPDSPIALGQHRVDMPDGRTAWHEWTDRGIFDEDGSLIEVLSVGHDITHLKESEAELRRLNRALRLISAVNHTLVRVDDENTLLQAVCDLTVEEGGYRMAWVGYAETDAEKTVRPMAWAGAEADYLQTINVTWAEEAEPRRPISTAIRTGKAAVERDIGAGAEWSSWRAEALARGYRSTAALPLITDDKTIGALTVYADEPDAFNSAEVSLLQQAVDDLAYGIGAIRSRVARIEVQVLLRAERQLMRTLIDSMPNPLYAKDRESRFLLANKEVTRLMGAASPEEVLGKTDFDFYPEELAQRFYEDDQQVMASGQPLLGREEPRRLDPDGNPRWVLTTKAPLHNDDGEVIGMVGTAQDITPRRLAQQELERERSLLRTLIDVVPDYIFLKDAEGRFLLGNATVARLMGVDSPDELLGKTDFDFFAADLAERFWVDELAVLTTGEASVNREETIPDKDGKIHHTLTTSIPLKNEQGEITGLVGFGRDISDIKRMEGEKDILQRQLLQSQKMEAIGQLTAGIAHDFNNLLTAINGFAELLQLEMSDDDPHQVHVDRILASGERAANLVRQLMIFSRREVQEPQLVQLNILVSSMESMLQRTLGEHILLKMVLPYDLWAIKADPSQMEQIIVNLAVNARDAMPDGGQLTIETDNVPVDADYARIHLGMEPGDYVMLAVSDTGVGMDDYVKSHLFEPFFTTKARGKGTGLGLSTVYGIVQQSQGHVWVYSEKGQGTTFKIYLPRVQVEGEVLPAPTAQATLKKGTETVLVVEDDANVLQFALRVLASQGYTVIGAADGPKALALAAEQHIDILVTDVVIPEMGGPEIARRIAEIQPGLKVLYISGYTENAIAHHRVLDEGVAFLQKPLSVAALSNKVRQVLDTM
jgi:two-component system, cell cycle sensor histidine kinase and response regulator CckA